MTPVYLNDLGMVCSLGDRLDTIAQSLFRGAGEPLSHSDAYSPGRSLPLGRVNTPLPSVVELPATRQSRSNQLLLAALESVAAPVRKRMAELDPLRVGVVMGSSTSGIPEGEAAMAARLERGDWPADFSYQQQEMSAVGESLAEMIGAQGPAYTISTACSSGAKALASGRRLLRSGFCDLVVAGGVDVLCALTVRGFSALESVSDAPCNPFSRNRRGINIGEAAALFIMSREEGPVALSGVGESSDAHHISAPAPDGDGAARAMAGAVRDAGVTAADLDYLNLHGTATPQNDRMESSAVNELGMAALPCSSTKAYTGHTLGAAGALEAGFCWLSLTQDRLYPNDRDWCLPVHRWDGQADPDLAPLNLHTAARPGPAIRRAMSNSFAFGGNNISLILERGV